MQSATGLSPCCVSGHLHSGTPKGIITKLGKLDCYIARSNPDGTPTEGAVLLITDVFGWNLPNPRLIADCYAKDAGMDCYVPDFHSGFSLSPEMMSVFLDAPKNRLYWGLQVLYFLPQFVSWVASHTDARSIPLFDHAIAELRETVGVKKLFAIGFCWGGRHVLLLGSGGKPKVDGVGSFHPGIRDSKEVSNLAVPTTFHLADNDPFFPPKNVEDCRKQLSSKSFQIEFHEYPKMRHGFATRGDPADVEIQKAKGDAHANTVLFFKSLL
ncbi:Alpha/Beta hydrolase protein [Cladochytrium replicatum]|nr:Alpha/Beta hydrolase protein [Cladochytrium replicatum]